MSESVKKRRSPKKGPVLIYACNICNEKLKSISELRRHASQHAVQLYFEVGDCGEVIVENEDVQSRLRKTSTNEGRFPCNTCGKRFQYPSKLKIHERVHSSLKMPRAECSSRQYQLTEKIHACPICGKGFRQLCNMKRHQNIHTRIKPAREKGPDPTACKCQICGKSFAYPSRLKRHEKMHLPASRSPRRREAPTIKIPSTEENQMELEYSCSVCSKVFRSDVQLKRHEALHSRSKEITSKSEENKNEHVCMTCGKCFQFRSNLRSHENTHTRQSLVHCSICRQAFTSKTVLKQHYSTHSNYHPYQCTICDRSFSKNYTLNKHMRLHTGNLPYKCDQCDRRYNSKAQLLDHSFAHTGKYPFICEFCGKGFRKKGYLMTHLQYHMGGKYKSPEEKRLAKRRKKPMKPRDEFPCSNCDRIFKSKLTLAKHQSQHTGEYKYKCNICNIGFIQKHNFMVHFEKHSIIEEETGQAQSQRKCDICNKEFKKPAQLKEHYRLHTGDRPYECQICGRGFNVKIALRNHMASKHTGDYPFRCIICDKGFCKKFKFEQHYNNHLADVKEEEGSESDDPTLNEILPH